MFMKVLTDNTMLKILKLILKNRSYNEHYPSILVTFLGETEHFSGKWSIKVEHFSGETKA